MTILTAFLVGFPGCGPQPLETPNRGRPLPVEVVVAERSATGSIRATVTGLVEARRRSDLGFELAGTLREVLIEEGQAVESNGVLARLDTARLKALRAEASAGISETEANLKLARATLARTRQARATEAVTAQALDEAERQVASLEAGLEAARARVASIDVDLEKSVLKAPFAGTIATRLADEGQVLGAGTPVLRLLESGPKEVVMGMDETLAGNLEPGDALTLTIRGREYPATLLSLLPERARRTRTVSARLRVADPENRLREGDLAHTSLNRVLREPGFWLPQSALTDNLRGLWAAYVVIEAAGGDARTVERVDLEVLYTEAGSVYVRGGLRAGDQVIADGLQRLSPGMQVTVEKTKPAATDR